MSLETLDSSVPSAQLTVMRLNAQAHALRAELRNLRESLTELQREVSSCQTAQLIEANQQLVLAAIESQMAAEAAERRLAELKVESQRDVLTNTPNRAVMQDRLQSAMALARRRGTRAAVLFVDLDNFKHINDTLGHDTGDMVLQTIARRLESCVRDSDTVSRHGGDEFLVLLSEVSQATDAALISKKMLADLVEPIIVKGQTLQTGASLGIAIFPDDSGDAVDLIKLADTAMYRSKRGGGGRYTFHADTP